MLTVVAVQSLQLLQTLVQSMGAVAELQMFCIFCQYSSVPGSDLVHRPEQKKVRYKRKKWSLVFHRDMGFYCIFLSSIINKGENSRINPHISRERNWHQRVAALILKGTQLTCFSSPLRGLTGFTFHSSWIVYLDNNKSDIFSGHQKHL